jgi:hypothetical protein
VATKLTLEPAEHPHHWLIGNQDGPMSEGVCKMCGVRRDFSNGFTRMSGPYVRRPQPIGIQADAPSADEIVIEA